MTTLRLRHAAALLTLSLAVASCSSKEATGADTNSTGAATIAGAPAGLAPVVAKAYQSKKAGATVPKGATAKLGEWKGQQVAVVTAGDDVTLAATSGTAKKWEYVGGWYPSLGIQDDLGKVSHVAVFGSDARPGQNMESTRADALQVLGIDGSGSGGVMGFARDIWVNFPGRGDAKLNSAMVNGGPTAQVKALQTLSGIPIQGYLLTGFVDFATLGNKLGGININLPKEVKTERGVVPAGGAQLTGWQALSLARERKSLPNGDFDRSKNQGLLLLAAAIKARIDGVAKLPASLTVVDQYVKSNLTAAQMLRFTAAFYRLNPLKVGHVVAKGPTGKSPSGESIVRVDQASKDAMKRFVSGKL